MSYGYEIYDGSGVKIHNNSDAEIRVLRYGFFDVSSQTLPVEIRVNLLSGENTANWASCFGTEHRRRIRQFGSYQTRFICGGEGLYRFDRIENNQVVFVRTTTRNSFSDKNLNTTLDTINPVYFSRNYFIIGRKI